MKPILFFNSFVIEQENANTITQESKAETRI